MKMSQREAQALLKQIGSLCEKAYRRGAHHALVLGMSVEDADWYRYHCADKFRGEDFHLIANRIPEPFSAEQTKNWPKAAQKNPSRFYAKHSNVTAVQMHGLNFGKSGKAFAELDELIKLASGE